MTIREKSIYDCILSNSRNLPNEIALVSGDISLTFSEFQIQVNSISRGLKKAGLEKGDRIGVLLNNCGEYALLLAACARIGLLAVCINTRTNSNEMRVVFENTKPKALFFQSSFEKHVDDLRDLIQANQLYSIDYASISSISFDQLVDKNSSSLKDPQPSIDEGWLIIPTAAVGGVPKGALLSQRNILASVAIHLHHFGRKAIKCHLVALPIFHIMGLTSVWATFISGGKNVVLKEFDKNKALKLIDDEKLTYFGSFPPVLERILDTAKEIGSKMKSLQFVYGLEGPENIKRLEQETSSIFWTGFGQAETTAFVTISTAKERPGASGKASLKNSVEIVNEVDEVLTCGEEGEIVVRGENIFLEYWGMPEETEYTLRNGWHHTGDIGRFDEDGYLWYVKRKAEKELIKTGGENVYPGEVENVLLKHPDIKACCVIGVKDNTWGESIKAVCECRKKSNLTLDKIRYFVGEHIASFKKPRHVVFVEKLPYKQNEIDREAVRDKWG